MAYSAKISYIYGSKRASTHTAISTSQLQGKSESAVMAFLKKKHANIKDLEIIIKNIEWK